MYFRRKTESFCLSILTITQIHKWLVHFIVETNPHPSRKPLPTMHSNFDMSFDMSTISFHCLACLNCDYVNGEIMLAGFHMIIFFHTICPTSMAGCPIYLESPLYKISSLFSHFWSFQILFYKKCLSLFFSECSFYYLGRFFASW